MAKGSLCTEAPPLKKVGERDVCESPSLIMFRFIFAQIVFGIFPLTVEKVLTDQHDSGLLYSTYAVIPSDVLNLCN